MPKCNEGFSRLDGEYLFTKTKKAIEEYSLKHNGKKVISLGVGDVSLPLSPAVAKAFSSAARKMGNKEGFHGYAPYFGYDFLRRAIADDYKNKGVDVNESEIFVSDGAKRELSDFLSLFSRSTALIPTPSYPVYVDANIMRGNEILFLPTDESDGFIPSPEKIGKAESSDGYIIYLCSPSNPTGTVYSESVLSRWVEFALETGSVIIFDAAYERYITDGSVRTVYSVDGAKNCAVEICSLSKSAGFTGVRCGWTVVPEKLFTGGTGLNKLWQRRQSTAMNGVSYPVQAAAFAALTGKGRKQTEKAVSYYLKNAEILVNAVKNFGAEYYGGVNSPYVWLKCPRGLTGKEAFSTLLNEYGLVVTPGEGFGAGGENYIRLSALNTRQNTVSAAKRLAEFFN